MTEQTPDYFAMRKSVNQGSNAPPPDYFAARRSMRAEPAKAARATAAPATAPQPTESAQQPKERQLFVNKGFVTAKEAEGQLISAGRGFMNLAASFQQVAMDQLAEFGLIDPLAADDFKRMTVDEKKHFRDKFNAEYGKDITFTFLEKGSELVPVLLMTPTTGKTAVGRIISGIVFGGAPGALADEGATVEERHAARGGEMRLGAAIGGGLSAVLDGVRFTRNLFREGIQDAIENGKEFAERGLEVMRRTGVKLKLSQIVDAPQIQDLERVARSSSFRRAGKVGGEFSDEAVGLGKAAKGAEAAQKSRASVEAQFRAVEDAQPKQAFKFFRKTMREIERQRPRASFGERVESAYRKVMGDSRSKTGLIGRRAAQANQDFLAAQKAGGKVNVSNTIDELNRMIAEYSDPLAGPVGKGIASDLSGILDELVDSGGKITPQRLQVLLENWGNAAKGTGKVLKDLDNAAQTRPMRRLFGTLNDDLDATIAAAEDFAAQTNAKVKDGARLLRLARDRYRENSKLIDEVHETSVGALLGTKTHIIPENLESKLFKMKPSEIRAFFNIMEDADPAIHRGLQRFWINQWMKLATKRSAAGAFPFAPGRMLDMNSGDNREVFKAVFRDPKIRAQVNLGLEAVERITLNNARTGGKYTAKLKEWAGVLASRDRTFAARLAAEMFAPNMIARYLTDEKSVKALQVLAAPFDQNRWSAAFTQLMNTMNEEG